VRAVRIDAFGGPEVLRVVDADEPEGELVLAVDAAGVNFGDVLVRQGTYFGGQPLPVWPGWEVVGRSDAGARLVALIPERGYAERVAVPRAAAWPVPDDVPDGVALAFVLQGVTAWHLLEDLRPGAAVLVTGAGSAVTHLVVQLALARGASRVAVVASSEAKAERVRALGAEAIGEVPRGRAFDLVVDMVGGELLDAALRALRPRGRAVLYGAAAGATNRLDTGALLRHGLTVSGFWLGHVQREQDLGATLAELWPRWRAGELRPALGPELALADAPAAHRVVEARTGAGKVVLRP
jgi:NADPH2:quinone reductase